MITITPAIRRMIGNHGEPLDLIRPIDSNGYAVLEDWDDPNETTIEIFAIIDHSGWVRELAPMEVSKIELAREQSFAFVKGPPCHVRRQPRRLTGRATASLTFEHGPAHVPGLLIRIENERAGTYYFTAAFGPGVDIDKETGERSPHVGPPFVDQGNTLTANYSLESHTAEGPEPYFPCEDIHFAHGEDYFG